MKCPVCKNVTLVMAEKSGVEIDYCPECRGVWLDRGELEKIAERMDGEGAVRHERREERNPHEEKRSRKHEYEDEHHYKNDKHIVYDKHGRPYKKKKSSVFGDIFDMIGGGGDD